MLLIKAISFTLLLCLGTSLAANIAIFNMSGSKSHKNVFRALMAELSRRGNTVTMFTSFPQTDNHSGVREIELFSGREAFFECRKNFLPGTGGQRISDFFGTIGTATEKFCREAAATQELKDMISGKDKYDLVLMDHFFEDCGVAAAYITKTPFIFVSTLGLFGHFAHNMRIPHPANHVPFWNSPYSDKMTFWERLDNLKRIAVGTYIRDYIHVPMMDATLRELFGQDLPSILEMERNASMIFINTHFTINHPTPYLPHTIEIGGILPRKGNPLPQDLQEWVDGAGNDGVVYFCLGTVLPAFEMEDQYRKVFIEAFGKLKQRVVWKWETGEMDGLPDNVKVFKYPPQQDLLASGKVKVFITHGGLLGLQEAVYHGVPVIGIPGGADQHFNMQVVLAKQIGLMQTWETITSDSLLTDITTIANNPSFKENIKNLAVLWADQPQPALQKAMFWIEHVIRHRGAPHLRSPVINMKWYEYYMVDIALFLLTVFIGLLLTIYLLLRFLYRCFFKRSSKSAEAKKKKRA